MTRGKAKNMTLANKLKQVYVPGTYFVLSVYTEEIQYDKLFVPAIPSVNQDQFYAELIGRLEEDETFAPLLQKKVRNYPLQLTNAKGILRVTIWEPTTGGNEDLAYC
jgi:propanediol dehydratase large subunit